MVRPLDAGFAAMCLAVATVLFFGFQGQDKLPNPGTTTASAATAVQAVVPVASTAAAGLLAGVALVFRHLHHAGGNRPLPQVLTFTLCVSAGTLQYVFFVQPAAGVVVIHLGGAQVRALGLAATAVTFFLGVATVQAHVVRAGGGGGGAPGLRILSMASLGAAAALVGIMALYLYTGTGY